MTRTHDEQPVLEEASRGPRRAPAELRSEGFGSTSPSAAGRPMGPSQVMALQRSAGNLAVSRLLAGDEPPAATMVQRQEEGEEEEEEAG